MIQYAPWFIQRSPGDFRDADLLAQACTALNIPHQIEPSKSFFDRMPIASSDTLFYGSALLLKNVSQAKTWKNNLFFHPKHFAFSNWAPKLKAFILNEDYHLTTIQEFVSEKHPEDTIFFLRPDLALKEFSGGLYTFKSFRELSEVDLAWFKLEKSLPIVVAAPLSLSCEWRTFMVDGEIAGGCQYKKHGELQPGNARLKPELSDF